MNHQEIQNRLDDYVDGALPEAERLDIEQHLESCSQCRQVVEETRFLLAEARALQQEVKPNRDLWPGIATKLSGREVLSIENRNRTLSRFWAHQRLLAAAAVLVVAVITLSVVRQNWQQELTEETTFNVLTEFDQVDAESNAASVSLFGTSQDAGTSWASRAVDAMGKNVQVVDGAIQDLRSALQSDPTDSRLAHRLRREYQRKTSLLRQTAQLIEKLNNVGSIDSLT
jgi:anti-sigma-K factor RskA